MSGGRPGPRGIFADDQTGGGQVLVKIPGRGRIGDIQSVAHHAHGKAAGAQGGVSPLGIHALCKAADYDGPAFGKALPQLSGAGDTVGRAASGAYQGHCRLLVQGGQPSLCIE